MAKVKQESGKQEAAQFNVKLMAADKIRKLIGTVGTLGGKFADAVHITGVQCILHAQKHGDATLADELVKTVRSSTPGYVWQGLVLWFRANSPITWDAEGKVSLLKEGDKGYKPFDPAKADAEPAAKAKEVTARTDRPIEPMSIAFIKGRIKSMVQQVEKAGKDGGRGFAGKTPEEQAQTEASTKAWIKRVAMVVDTIDGRPISDAEAKTQDANNAKQEKAAA